MIKLLLSLLYLVPQYPIGTKIRFEWEAPTANVDGSELTPLRGYRIYIQPRGKAWRAFAHIAPNRLSMPFVIRERNRYRVRITAVNIEGLESAPSNEVEFITDTRANIRRNGYVQQRSNR